MDHHLINTQATLLDALDKLNRLSGAAMTLFVVDDRRRLLGTLTDGDIRRALLGGAQTSTPVDAIMHRDFRAMTGDVADVDMLRQFRDMRLRLIPWLNDDGTIRTIVDLAERPTILPLNAILMAGGRGERLRPLTLTTPKPLLPIGGKPIIDYNVEALARCGVTDITVTTRYLADMISDHFSAPVAGVRVRCVREDIPLGTIGSAALADLPGDGCSIVMNSDLLTTISFEDMYLHHIDSGADITIAVIPYQVSIPYAIVATDDDGHVTGIDEKPTLTYYANAGIYIMPNALLRTLPTDTPTDATDLIEDAIARGMRVTQFPINGTWIDIGSPADFRQANELVRYVQRGDPH